jgi:hypothetical protein
MPTTLGTCETLVSFLSCYLSVEPLQNHFAPTAPSIFVQCLLEWYMYLMWNKLFLMSAYFPWQQASSLLTVALLAPSVGRNQMALTFATLFLSVIEARPLWEHAETPRGGGSPFSGVCSSRWLCCSSAYEVGGYQMSHQIGFPFLLEPLNLAKHLPWLPDFSITWASTPVQSLMDVGGAHTLFSSLKVFLGVCQPDSWKVEAVVERGQEQGMAGFCPCPSCWSVVNEPSCWKTNNKPT